MTRTFLHKFDPPAANPISGSTASLSVQEIENAGVKEVLQTPGAPFGSWAFLDTLLHPTGAGTPFLFREPLGQAREVKVALSGLFGRFVARAYLERYFGLSIFVHLGKRSIVLDGKKRIVIARTARGDLPDWVACASNLSHLTVAEAKGCHDPAGPGAALKRAWAQVNRVDVKVSGRRVTVKRIAVATRWGSATGGAADSRLSVQDPEDTGEPMSLEEMNALYVGMLRLHIASLIAPLGHERLAGSLVQLASAPHATERSAALQQARVALEAASLGSGVTPSPNGNDDVIGGLITRAGPLSSSTLSTADQRALFRLALHPAFVGIERNVILAAIGENVSLVRSSLAPGQSNEPPGRRDAVGTWFIPLGEGPIL